MSWPLALASWSLNFHAPNSVSSHKSLSLSRGKHMPLQLSPVSANTRWCACMRAPTQAQRSTSAWARQRTRPDQD